MQPSTGEMTSCGCRSTKPRLRKKAKSAFETGFRYPTWVQLVQAGNEKQDKWCPDTALASNPQCDLYLKKDAPPLRVFRHTCFKNASLSGVASRCGNLTASVALAEISQTPASAKQAMAARRSNALWSTGNPTAGCCVVCINGEGAEFEVAAKLAAAGLRTLSDRAKL